MAQVHLGSVCPLGIKLNQYFNAIDNTVIFVDAKNTNKVEFIFTEDGHLFFVGKPNIKTLVGRIKYGREWVIRFTFDLEFFDKNNLICDMAFKLADKEFIQAKRSVVQRLVRNHNNIFNLSAN